jgi:hypothetical protein
VRSVITDASFQGMGRDLEPPVTRLEV